MTTAPGFHTREVIGAFRAQFADTSVLRGGGASSSTIVHAAPGGCTRQNERMLGRLGAWRHVVAGLAVLVISVLAFTGVTGRGDLPERFDAKVVTVQPEGADGVRIREVVDQDFGTKRRHGYERIIPTDFGHPSDIEASSPNANADIDVTPLASADRIRLGDPDKKYTGRHRYILSYTLPNARISTGQLFLDIIGDPDDPEELETRRFEVVLTGLELADPACDAGPQGAKGGCTLERDGDVYRAVVRPLKKAEGITISGTIVGRLPIVEPVDPPQPPAHPDHRLLLGILSLVLGSLAVIVVYLLVKRAGRNEVFAGGAADAAYGSLPDPTDATAARAIRLVADTDMDELATIEFVPPKGIQPWQGSVLLKERVDRDTVAAWISGLTAHEAISLSKENGDLTLRRGDRYDSTDATTQALINRLLDNGDELTLGKYNANFKQAWQEILTTEKEQIAASGWWKRLSPGGGGGALAILVALVIMVVFGFGSIIGAVLGLFHHPVLAVLLAIFVPAIVAHSVYGVLRSIRSATGSALALRTESFRRFLAASEGKHVDWAWKQGLLREYSAWAVALDTADAWGKALANSNVPEREANLNTPLLVYSMGSAFNSTYTAPSSSSSGGSSFGGGGFSGGVGGGGGGGSSGSW